MLTKRGFTAICIRWKRCRTIVWPTDKVSLAFRVTVTVTFIDCTRCSNWTALSIIVNTITRFAWNIKRNDFFSLEYRGDLYFNFVNFWLKVSYLLYAIINLNTASFLVMDGQVFFLNLVFVSFCSLPSWLQSNFKAPNFYGLLRKPELYL